MYHSRMNKLCGYGCFYFAMSAIVVAQAQPPNEPAKASALMSIVPAVAPAKFEHEAPELGVVVAPSPGTGVLIVSVEVDSPAESIGMRPGDFILSINKAKVSTPTDLAKAIQRKTDGKEIEIVFWQNGKEQSSRVALTSGNSVLFQRAWLGVVLSEAEGRGAKIEQVHPKGPAAIAGVQPDDIVTSVNTSRIATSRELIDMIATLKPRAKVTLGIERDGQALSVAVTVAAYPSYQLLRDDDRPPLRGFDSPDIHKPSDPRRDHLRESLDDMRQQVRNLRQELRDLRRSPVSSALPPGSVPQRYFNPQGSKQTTPRTLQQYHQNYGHYYQFQRPETQRYQDNSRRQRSRTYYGYYPYALPPYGYDSQYVRPYYYLSPDGLRFGMRVGPYWLRGWF